MAHVISRSLRVHAAFPDWITFELFQLLTLNVPFGCGAVGRAVGFDTRDKWFKSQHRQINLSANLSIA